MTAVSAGDIAAAIIDVPAAVRRQRDHRAEIERQHAQVAALRAKATRVSVDGAVFDLGDGWYVSVRNGPTPRGSSLLYLMATVPILAEDVDDFHGGWAP